MMGNQQRPLFPGRRYIDVVCDDLMVTTIFVLNVQLFAKIITPWERI